MYIYLGWKSALLRPCFLSTAEGCVPAAISAVSVWTLGRCVFLTYHPVGGARVLLLAYKTLGLRWGLIWEISDLKLRVLSRCIEADFRHQIRVGMFSLESGHIVASELPFFRAASELPIFFAWQVLLLLVIMHFCNTFFRKRWKVRQLFSWLTPTVHST